MKAALRAANDVAPRKGERVRLRQVSPERIKKAAAAFSTVCPLYGLKLSPDGSAIILTALGAEALRPEKGGGDEW